MHTPPPQGQEERRREYRREDDREVNEIVDHAVAEAPIVSQLVKTSKVAGAIAIIFTMIGGITGAVATAVTDHSERTKFENSIDARVAENRAQIDSNHRMIVAGQRNDDSILVVLREIRYVQCIQLRRSDPDLLPDGCMAAPVKRR